MNSNTRILELVLSTPGGQELYTVTTDTGVASALRMSNGPNGPKHMLVMDHGMLQGVVTRGDLARAKSTALVQDAMKTPVLCIASDTAVSDVAQIFAENGVSFLPVVHLGNIVGAATPEMIERSGVLPRHEEPAPKPAYNGNRLN